MSEGSNEWCPWCGEPCFEDLDSGEPCCEYCGFIFDPETPARGYASEEDDCDDEC